LLSEMYDWVRNRFVASSQNSLSMQKEEQLWITVQSYFENEIQWNPTWCVLDFSKKRITCDLNRSSEYLTSVFNFLFF
jgi:hypothetical protein